MTLSLRKILVLAALALPGLTACNTIAGVGTDVKKAGEVIAREAEEAKN